jgi:hypothetical protein
MPAKLQMPRTREATRVDSVRIERAREVACPQLH